MLFRSFCEYFRQPDTTVGLLPEDLTMGQILSLLTIAAGLLLDQALTLAKRAKAG